MVEGLDWMTFKGPFQPKPFCDSTKAVPGKEQVQGLGVTV